MKAIKEKSISKVVTIVGNIGTGKSTAMPLMTKALGAYSVEADNLFQTTNPFRGGYLENLERWCFTSELWMTWARAEMIKRELEIAKKKKVEWVAIDSGMIMSWVYMKMHHMFGEISEDEWELFAHLFDHLTVGIKTDIIIWIDCSVDTALERVRKRGRGYELQFYTREYLENLNEAVVQVVKKMELDGVKVVRLHESEIGNIVESEICQNELMELVVSRI